jgi:lipopolysaccharide export system protein LptA
VNRSSSNLIVFWFFILGVLPIVTWAAPSPTPKAGARSSARTQGSPAKAAKAKGGTKGTGDAKATVEAKKTPGDVLGGDNSDQNKGPTEVTAKDEVQFNGQTHMAVFIGSVKVIDPQFTMTTDKLTVWMNKQEEGGGIRDAEADGNVIIVHLNPPKDDKTAAQAGSSPGASPLARPVAKPVATVAEMPAASPSASTAGATAAASPSATPVLSTGRARKALYNAKQDAVTLLGWPQVTQGVNTHIATEEGTRMILYRDGRLETFGPSRTIIQDKGENNPEANATASPKNSQANAAASPNKPQHDNVLP